MTDRDWEKIRTLIANEPLFSGRNKGHVEPGSAARVLRALSLHHRLEPAPFDALKVLGELLKVAGNHPAGALLHPQIDADPELALMELFAVLYASLSFHVQRVADTTLENLLGLAGVTKRGPRPAAVLLEVQGLAVGTRLNAETCFVPTSVIHPPLPGRKAEVREPLDATAENGFSPAWPIVGWRCEVADRTDLPRINWGWRVTMPPEFLTGKCEAQAYVASSEAGVLDTLRAPATWTFQPDGQAEHEVQVRPWLAEKPDGPDDPYRAPTEWLAFAATRDPAGWRLADRWLTFRLAVAPDKGDPGGQEVTGTLKRIPLPPDESAGVDQPTLKSNCVAWLNASFDGTSRAPFDRMGLWDLPAAGSGGARFNGCSLEGWVQFGGPPSGPISLRTPGSGPAVANGGLAAEGVDEFLQRAPAALRHRGSPVSVDDWERFVAELDVAERIVAAGARGTLLPRGSSVGSAVQIFFHAVGPVESAARLATWLRDTWVMKAAVLVRPLGTEVEVFIPHPVRVFVLADVMPSRQRSSVIQEVRTLFELDTDTRDDGKPLWRHLLESFRSRGPADAAELPDLLAEYLGKEAVMARLGQAPNAIRFEIARDVIPAAEYSSAVPILVWPEEDLVGKGASS